MTTPTVATTQGDLEMLLDFPDTPMTAGLSLAVGGIGTVVATLGSITDIPGVQTVLVAGGLAAALTGIGIFVRAVARGALWGIRAADGMGELMGDPTASPPVPGLGDRMERVEATVDDVKRSTDALTAAVAEMHEQQREMYEWHREVLQKAAEPPPEPPED